jgi:biotin operon repressor
MRRADRLFQIIQVLRRTRKPLTADAIAAELETSKRTIYRDIATLIGQRVPIRGEAGMGYILEKGFDLPPLMLTPDEIEAAVLGAQWVASNADPVLARAATGVCYGYFERCDAAAEWLETAVKRGWRAVMEFAPEERKTSLELWPGPPGGPAGDLELMRRVKALFDPSNLLNRGRLYRRI